MLIGLKEYLARTYQFLEKEDPRLLEQIQPMTSKLIGVITEDEKIDPAVTYMAVLEVAIVVMEAMVESVEMMQKLHYQRGENN